MQGAEGWLVRELLSEELAALAGAADRIGRTFEGVEAPVVEVGDARDEVIADHVLFGYARVSKGEDQSTAVQRRLLRDGCPAAAGIDHS